jgi:hypothetical protein
MGMRMRRSLGLAVVTLFVMASGGNATSLIPLSDNPGGQSPEMSAEQWLQWLSSYDTAVVGGDPITDPTGEFQAVNQIYPVTMLGGTFGGDATRAFNLPARSIVMMPLINSFCTGGNPAASGGLETPCTDSDLEGSKAYLDTVDRLFLRINGNTIFDADTLDEVDAIDAALRIETDFFSAELAPNSFWTGFGLDAPAGTYPSNYNVGFYAFALLDEGVNTLEFGGGNGDFVTSVAARVRVAPIPLPAALPLLVAGIAGLGLKAQRRRKTA